MEQILAFVLGVSIVIFIWVVVVAFRAKKLTEQNETSILNIENWISKNDELVNRRIDQEIDRVNELTSNCIRYTDSRVDKLEQKLTSINNDGCKPVKNKLIKG
jgi:septation ring formation regulator EzrA